MGFVDRGGGREAKGASLRRSKKNPGAAAARARTEVKAAPPPTKLRAAAPVFPTERAIMDCSVAILSRKFDADRDRIVDRAASEAECMAMLVWCGEVERQEALAAMCAEYPGRLFSAIGVHPDNVDRTNKKAHQGWVEATEMNAREAHCVAILTGLDTTREQATHFSQEALMKDLFLCAKRMQMAVVVHLHADVVTADRFVEWWGDNLSDASWSDVPMVFHDAVALATVSSQFLKFILACDHAFALVSARGLFGNQEDTQATTDALSTIASTSRAIVGSDSPWHTPQNLPDEHLCTLHNDPANVSFVVDAIAEALSVGKASLLRSFQETAVKTFFRLVSAVAAEPTEDSSSGSSNEASDGDDDDECPAGQVPVPTDNRTAHPAEPVVEKTVVALANANPSRFFSCIKCRARSFCHNALVTHTATAQRVSFKGKGEGSCESTFFLVVNGDVIQGGLALTVGQGDVALCKGCGCKMGSIATDTACPCGARMEGMTARIIASRVEAVDDCVTDKDLLARAEEERSRAVEDVSADSSDDHQKKRRPKQNVKNNNRSNMSNYRNKNFTPGVMAATEASLGQLGAKEATKKRRKGKRGPDSDDD